MFDLIIVNEILGDEEWVRLGLYISSYNSNGLSTHYCNGDKFGMSACFLRVGEDDDDVNSEYYGELGYELAYLTRPSIEVIDVAFDEKNKLLTETENAKNRVGEKL